MSPVVGSGSTALAAEDLEFGDTVQIAVGGTEAADLNTLWTAFVADVNDDGSVSVDGYVADAIAIAETATTAPRPACANAAMFTAGLFGLHDLALRVGEPAVATWAGTLADEYFGPAWSACDQSNGPGQ